MTMDRFDREILRRLQDDGRSSFTDIGKAVHLSPNAVAERVRRLSREGVIRAVRAIVDPRATGSFDYALRVACRDREELVALMESLRSDAGGLETNCRLILREFEVAAV